MSTANRYSVNLTRRPHDRRTNPARRGHWLTTTALGAAGLFALASAPAQAGVTGGSVAQGMAQIVNGQTSGSVTINQQTDKAVINWSTFSNSAGEVIQFNQPNASSITLNRVTGAQNPTVINGALNANGQVWVLNPYGVMVGGTGSINVRGFLGTTHAITDGDFLAGNYTFTDAAVGDGYGNFAEVVNEGLISASNGYAVLAGREVRNGNNTTNGNVFADLGYVVLAGAPTFTMGIGGDKLLSFAVGGEFASLSGGNPLVSNTGNLNAAGGKVLMTARAASNIVASVVNMGGSINATTARVVNGVINLTASSGTDSSGAIIVDGGANGAVEINRTQVDPNNNNAPIGGILNVNSSIDAAPGTITVLGNDIRIGNFSGAKLLASALPGALSSGALADGGTISIGRGLAGTEFANAPLAKRIILGPQSSSNFVDGLAVVEVQARAFGGTGRQGGDIFLYTAPDPAEGPTLSTSAFIDVQASGNFQGAGGLNGTGGTVEVVTREFVLRPSGTITANSVTNPGTGGGGGTGGAVRIAAQTLETVGSASAPFDTRISASGNIKGGDIFFGGGPNGTAAVAGQALARSIRIGPDSSLRASAADVLPGTPGGRIIVRTATTLDPNNLLPAPNLYIDGGLSNRGGNGGILETVGYNVQITGHPDPALIDSVRSGIDAGGYAPGGTNGTWLIAGRNLKVVESATVEPAGVGIPEIDARVLSGALGSSVADLQGMPIFGATDIKLADGANGGGANNALIVNGTITLDGLRDAKLDLISDNRVEINRSIQVLSPGNGKLALTARAGHSIESRNAGELDPPPQIRTNGGNVVYELGGDPNGPNGLNGFGFYPDGIFSSLSILTDGGAVTFRSLYNGSEQTGAVTIDNAAGIITSGGAVNLAAGDFSTIYNFGTIDSGAGNVALSVRNDGGIFLEQGSHVTTTTGDISLVAGQFSEIDNIGEVSSVGTTSSSSGDIGVTVGDFSAFYNDRFGSGYGSFSTDGGQVSFVGGMNSIFDISGENGTNGGAFTATLDSGSELAVGGFLGTSGGNVTINAADGSYVYVGGTLSAASDNGGNISIAVGNGGDIYVDGAVETVGGTISLTGGPGSVIDNYGTISSSGGAISLVVGDATLDGDGYGYGYGYYYGGIYNAGHFATGGGNLSLTTGANGYIETGLSGGSILTVGGNASFSVGNGGYIDIDVGSFTHTGGGQLSFVGGNDSYIGLYGQFTTVGGDISVAAGDASTLDIYGDLDTGTEGPGGNLSATAGNDSAIYLSSFTTTGGGNVTLTVGDRSGVITDGFLGTLGGNVTIAAGNGGVEVPSGYINYGTIDTGNEAGVGGNFTVTAGNDSFSQIFGEIFTGGGNIAVSHGANSSIDIGFSEIPECVECYGSSGFLDAGTGDVLLTADTINVAAAQISLLSESPFEPINIFGDDIRLNADNMNIDGRVLATNSIALAPRTINRAITIGGFGDVADGLSLDDFELDNIDAPTIVFGRDDGTGAVNVFIEPDSGPPCQTDCSFEEGPSSIIIKSGGVGGTITVHGTGETDDLESIRLVAGSNITLAEDFGLLLPGKLELVSGGSFTNLAGADALTTVGDGQWLIYSANPSADVFGGLLSGQRALWGQDFATVAASGIAHSGNLYAFGLAPTVTVTALNRSKTYGDTLGLSSVLGTDYSVSGLVNAAQFGGVFVQDSLTGAPTLASSGAAATANAGSYAITIGTGTGISAGNGYNLVFQSGSLTVDPRQLTASLIGSVAKVYDATTAATLAAGNYSLAGFVNGDGATIGQTSGSFSSPNVGSGLAVTAALDAVSFAANSGTSLSNYVLPTFASGAIGTITPATLTYVANPVARQRGVGNPALGGSVTGFVGGETQATATSGTLAFTTTATIDSPAGNYAIAGGGLTAGNYVFVQAPGNATAFLVQDSMMPAQQITTTVIQQVTNSTRTPTPPPTPANVPTPTPPPAGGLTGGVTGVGPTGTSAPPPPPPPPPSPPPSSVTGGNPPPPPPPGPPVESTPPSPVGDTAPPTPSDAADEGDPVLAEAETPEEEQEEPSSEKRQLASTTVVVPGVNVEVPTPPRSTDVPGAEQSFSGSGNPAQW